MHTKEQVRQAARKRFKTQDVVIDGEIKVTLRELPQPELDALRKRMFKVDDKGELCVDNGNFTYREDAHPAEEWLAATMSPEYTVAELLAPDWPTSLKMELWRQARALNGYTIEDAVGNS